MGLLRWLRRFFYSDDPVVKLIGALTEPELELRRGLLTEEGIVTMMKNRSFLSHMWGSAALPFENSHDLYVKQSDLTRAEAILGAFDLERSGDAPETGSWHSRDRE